MFTTSILRKQVVCRILNIAGENTMKDAPWKMFHFTYQIGGPEQENVIVCRKYLSQLPLLMNEI